MNAFAWDAGHLGWGLFALLVYTGVWLLASDLTWRLTNIAIRRLLTVMACIWTVGVALIVWWFVGV